MTAVSFYLLASESAEQRRVFACKLIEKSWRSDCCCYVLTDSSAQSQMIDDLLWTFRAGSFIPHQLYAGEPPEWSRLILIGSVAAPENWRHTVVNLSAQCPPCWQQCDRILEILDNSETTKAAGRLRYRHYQQAGAEISTHKL